MHTNICITFFLSINYTFEKIYMRYRRPSNLVKLNKRRALRTVILSCYNTIRVIDQSDNMSQCRIYLQMWSNLWRIYMIPLCIDTCVMYVILTCKKNNNVNFFVESYVREKIIDNVYNWQKKKKILLWMYTYHFRRSKW